MAGTQRLGFAGAVNFFATHIAVFGFTSKQK
jgi:hypothetical protein